MADPGGANVGPLSISAIASLMAELAGPRAAGTAVGLGLAVSSAGVSLGPPLFGWLVEITGGYRPAWITPLSRWFPASSCSPPFASADS